MNSEVGQSEHEVICPECQEKFNDVCAFCPNCGCPITYIKGIPYWNPYHRDIPELYPDIIKKVPYEKISYENPHEIVKCNECGMPISIMAEFCVHCGVSRIRSDSHKREFQILQYENGDRYEGEVCDNERDGEGTYIWADGLKYIGTFKKNMRHGSGRYVDKFGRVTLQNWEYNVLIESSSE